MEVEREVVDLYRATFMRDKVGNHYEGTVTGLVGSGVFVALDAPFVDVLVRFEELGRDHYELDDDGLRVVGARSGDSIQLGDRMAVEISDVAILRRTVYARRLVSEAQERASRTRGPRTRGSQSVRSPGKTDRDRRKQKGREERPRRKGQKPKRKRGR